MVSRGGRNSDAELFSSASRGTLQNRSDNEHHGVRFSSNLSPMLRALAAAVARSPGPFRTPHCKGRGIRCTPRPPGTVVRMNRAAEGGRRFAGCQSLPGHNFCHFPSFFHLFFKCFFHFLKFGFLISMWTHRGGCAIRPRHMKTHTPPSEKGETRKTLAIEWYFG